MNPTVIFMLLNELRMQADSLDRFQDRLDNQYYRYSNETYNGKLYRTRSQFAERHSSVTYFVVWPNPCVRFGNRVHDSFSPPTAYRTNKKLHGSIYSYQTIPSIWYRQRTQTEWQKANKRQRRFEWSDCTVESVKNLSTRQRQACSAIISKLCHPLSRKTPPFLHFGNRFSNENVK